MNTNFEKEKMKRFFKSRNLSLYKIVSNLFTVNVKKITFLGTDKLKQLPEYKFSLLKFNVILENYCNYILYIKLINDYQLEESLFCYWQFCEENYLINKTGMNNRTNIKSHIISYYEKRFELQLQINNNIKSSIVNIIDLDRFSYKNINKDLFIAII